MPHYKDGKEARVGDLVKGVTYNRKGAVLVGTVLSVSAGTESCNCMVAFCTLRPLPAAPESVAWHDVSKHPTVFVSGGQTMLVPDYDYGETRAFELLHRPD